MKVTNLELQSKITDLLVGRIFGLEWFYYDLDLYNIDLMNPLFISSSEIKTFFDRIQPNGFGRFEYVEAPPEATYVVKILMTIIDFNPKLLPQVVKSLFKNNEITNESDSDDGMIGKLNQKNREVRNRLFKEKMRSKFRDDPTNVVILAEGDSWFQFPRIYVKDPVYDIIDWLIKDKSLAIKSLAAGGDWLSNIFYGGEYIEELPKITPDVFLISGGGNDLVGNNRLGVMTRNLKLEGENDLSTNSPMFNLIQLRKTNPDIDIEKYVRGLKFTSPDFFKFLNIYLVQYFVFLYNICHHPKYRKMIIITQGYDYAIPYNDNRGNWLSFQRVVNEVTDTGHWLFEPLCMKGITNEKDQEAVLYTLIFEFNEMLIKLATSSRLPNIFHIDCRGCAEESDWFDELHLKSEKFKQVASTFKLCIQENLHMKGSNTKKVYKVIDQQSSR